MRTKVQSLASAVLLGFLASHSVFAEEATDPCAPTQMSEYIRVALLNNPRLKAKFANWKATVEEIPQAKALEDPKFTYGYFIENVETRVGPQQNRFGIMQVFPWFGVIESRTDAATSRARAAYEEYEAARDKIVRDVKKGFYDYVYLLSSIDIARENVQLLKHFEVIARTRYKVAAASHPDVIRAQLELALMQDVLATLEEMERPTVATLNALLNREVSSPLPSPVKPSVANIYIAGDQLEKAIVARNPEIMAVDRYIAAAQSKLELAKKEFYPNIGVGLEWIQTGSAIAAVPDDGQDALILTFAVNIPLWREKYSAGERQTAKLIQKEISNKQYITNSLLTEAAEALYRYNDGRRKRDLYREIMVPKAKELVTASESAYRSGSLDFLSLIDAQRTLLKYTLEYERALTITWKELAELEMLAATEFSNSDTARP